MRILNVIMCLDPVAGGGAVERIYQLGRHLALAQQHSAILTTRQGWDENHVRGLGKVNVIAVPYVSERFKVPIGLPKWLKSNLADYDIVHLALNWTAINAITYTYLSKLGRPYVMSAMGWLDIQGRSRLLKHAYRHKYTLPMIRNARRCIAITPREVDDYLQHGVPAERIVKIPNGIDPEYFNAQNDEEFRRRHGLDERPIVLFVGRIDPIKGPDLLVQAFQRVSASFPQYQLVVAGNDLGYRPELKALTSSLGLDAKVTILGPIVGPELSWAYHAAELFVIPSRYDTMTIVALGAAASGTPILLTDQCDFSELQDAGGGLVVDCSVAGLETGLRQLLADPARMQTMGRKASDFVRSHYRWSDIAQRFVEVFESALSSNSPKSRALPRSVPGRA